MPHSIGPGFGPKLRGRGLSQLRNWPNRPSRGIAARHGDMWRGSPKGAAHSEGGGGTAAAAFDGDDEASVAGNDGSDILQYGADEGGGG
jgi:hypothetical protein